MKNIEKRESLAHELKTIHATLQSAMTYLGSHTSHDERFKRYLKLGSSAVKRLNSVCQKFLEQNTQRNISS